MKIKVISLEGAEERRRNIKKQFGRLDTPFDFFDAVTPERSATHIHGYDEHEFMTNCGRAATDAEIACYASHLALWRQCAEENESFLILEDDAHLHELFETGLLVTASVIRRLGFVRVSLPRLKTSTAIDRLGDFDIHYCRRSPLLALGYALSPAVARLFSARGSLVEEPVDKFLQRFWRHGQPVYAVTPPIVRLSNLAHESDIGERHRPRPGVRLWLRRLVRKTQNSIRRTLYNARYLGKLKIARPRQATAPAAASALRVR